MRTRSAAARRAYSADACAGGGPSEENTLSAHLPSRAAETLSEALAASVRPSSAAVRALSRRGGGVGPLEGGPENRRAQALGPCIVQNLRVARL
jgi:hypothetical protein